MSEETTRRALSPPQITDSSDDDAPDEIVSLLGKEKVTNWPPKECNEQVIDKLCAYGQRLATKKVLKSVALAIIAGVSAVVYTYILLSVR